MKPAMLAAIALGSLASVAVADVTFFVFEENELFRFEEGGPIDNFVFDDNVTFVSSTVGPNGQIVGVSGRRLDASVDPNRPHVTYELADPFGANPTPVAIFNSIDNDIPVSVTYVNGVAYGYDAQGAGLFTYDATTLDAIASLGQTTVAGDPQFILGANGLAYDEANDILYGISGDFDLLFVIDLNDLSNTQIIGGLGINYFNGGLEFLDGVLYAAVQNLDSGFLEVGSINTSTGAFTTIQQVSAIVGDPVNNPADRRLVSLAVVPAPATAGMLGLAGLVAIRRRR